MTSEQDQSELEKAFAAGVRKALPGASVGIWAYQPPDPTWHGGAWFSRVFTADGGDIPIDSGDEKFDRIVSRYADRLGWTGREEGLMQVFSFDEGRDISDPESGELERGNRHPAVEWMWW